MFHGVFSFGNSTSVLRQAFSLRATMKIKQGHDNQIERSTSEICKSSTPVVLNSEGSSPVAQGAFHGALCP